MPHLDYRRESVVSRRDQTCSDRGKGSESKHITSFLFCAVCVLGICSSEGTSPKAGYACCMEQGQQLGLGELRLSGSGICGLP